MRGVMTDVTLNHEAGVKVSKLSTPSCSVSGIDLLFKLRS